ncbi:unnamed protein product [Oreochromis niloticus]|nr:unnamed protein product [Mustela putorius furo]
MPNDDVDDRLRAGVSTAASTPSATFSIQPPEPFDFSKPHEWTRWVRRFERFRQASNLSASSEENQVNTLIYCMGDEADDVLRGLKLSDVDQRDYAKVRDSFHNFFIVRKNVYERARFNMRKQEPNETVDAFVTALHALAEHCNYGPLHDELIRDRIVVGLADTRLSERMQMEKDLDLDKAINMARQSEEIKKQQSALRSETNVMQVNAKTVDRVIQKHDKTKFNMFKNKTVKTQQQYSKRQSNKCYKCGGSPHPKLECPANDAKCHLCGKKGHYQRVCRQSKTVQSIEEEEEQGFFLGSVSSDGQAWTAIIQVKDAKIAFKLDTGADVTVIADSDLSKIFANEHRPVLQQPEKPLLGPGKTPLDVAGFTKLQLNYRAKQTTEKVYVVRNLSTLLLGLPAITALGLLVRVDAVSMDTLKTTYPKLCNGLGKVQRAYHIKVKPNAVPVDIWKDPDEETRFFVNLFCAAAEREQQTGEKILELLSSVCTYQTFPVNERGVDDDDYIKKSQCNFLLDLYFHVKDCETKTGLSVLPSLQSVFQSAPAVWSIKLSERKTSILLEVLKLQPEKKQVELTGCSHEESEVRSFLQCLPYISQLRIRPELPESSDEIRIIRNLFSAAAEREQQTGEKILELLSSVCRYKNSPLKEKQCDFLMDLYSYETKTGLSVLPSLQSVFQSAPAVWSINLSERKTSILLEVLKLQPEKKQVKMTVCSHRESEVRSFLQCLPYISQLSFKPELPEPSEEIKFLRNLFCAAAEREQQTGEKIMELLSSVCIYKNSPLKEKWCDFLMDLYSYETKTSLSVLPSLQSVPAVWSINLSERKTSILLEVLKLQPEKKQVELTGCSHEESEERIFLQCLPYISQLSVYFEDSDEEIRFFVNLFCAAAEREQQTGEKILELLSSVCIFNMFPFDGYDDDLDKYRCDLLLDMCSDVKDCETKTGLSVLPSLQSVFQSAPAVWSINLSERKTSILLEVLKLQPEKKQVELTGCSHEESEVRSFLQCLPYISQLRLSIDMSLLLFQWVRRGRVVCPLAVEELSLVPKKARPSQRVMLRAVSSLASLLRYWTVGRLDLTETCIPAQGLITLVLHDAPLTVKLSEESFQQLLCLLHEIQDKDLTLSFLSKVGGDLTSCCLNWELLHYLLQQSSAQTITVDLRKNLFLQEETTRLLPFLDRIVFKRPSPSFVMSSIRELYRAHDSHAVPSLLRSFGHVINLSCRELDSVDCAALIFILKHGDGVKLNLLWTSIPAEGVESILFMLDKVSHLSVDRNQLLRFIHCCAACDVQQEAASGLLRTLQHSLDLSCSSCVELSEEAQTEPLSLTADDCRAVSTILTHNSRDTQLDLRDCEVEDSVLDLLFPVLHRVRLRVSKTVLLQLLSLVPVNSERDTVRRAVSLCRALGGELDLSHSTLDQRACGALVQMLDSCEGLTELDLSHCQLTDQLLLPLITHLHKVQVLE